MWSDNTNDLDAINLKCVCVSVSVCAQLARRVCERASGLAQLARRVFMCVWVSKREF